jgi:site-specific DNA recombinase
MFERGRESRDHKRQVAGLCRRYEMLQIYMDKAYIDKFSEDLSQSEWREKNDVWKREREEIKTKIDTLDSAKDEYIESGAMLIELAQRSEILYKAATPAEKRQLIEIVSSNRGLKDGSIGFSYRKPFDLLAETASEEKWWTNPRV